MKKEVMEKRLMVMNLNDLQRKADKEFQLMRRLEEADDQGVVRCISCGSFHHYKLVDGGHFIPRQHKGTRYKYLNVWPQCKKCNKWLKGNHANYRDGLVKKIGRDLVEKLEESKNNSPGPQTWREVCIETYFHAKKRNSEILKTIGLD